MPCTYTGSLEGDRILALSEANKEKKATLTKVTDMLCRSCQAMENAGTHPPADVAEWWAAHKQLDAARLAKEKKDAARKRKLDRETIKHERRMKALREEK